MRFSTLVASTTALAAGVLAQTPEGSSPVVSTRLGVKYGSTVVTPGIQLPQPQTLTTPTISNYNGTASAYTVLLVDLSIPVSRLNLSAAGVASLIPGLGPNRTTRLHWWQSDLTPSANGSLIASSAAVAPYGGPMPPAGDVPHSYTFYLFAQPANYTPPTTGEYQSTGAQSRMNFSVAGVVDAFGEPVAANYIRVQNLGNASATSTAGANASAGATAAPSVSPFTGAAAAGGVGMGVQAVVAGVGMLAFALI